MISGSIVFFFVELEFGSFTAAGATQRNGNYSVHVEQKDWYTNRNGETCQHWRHYDLKLERHVEDMSI